MSSVRGILGPIAALAAGDQSFTVFCFATKDEVQTVFKPGYFQVHSRGLYDGDLLVTNHVPAKTGINPNPRGCKVVSMIHKDHRGQVSLTRLFELPHDPQELLAVLAKGLSAHAEPRYVPSRLEVVEQRRAEQAAEQEAALAANQTAAAVPERSAPASATRSRGRLHLKGV